MGTYNVHAGHNPDGKVACGAVGLIKESTEARKVKDEVIRLLRLQGHTVYDCTVNNGTSSSDVLTKIVKKCNSHKVDLDISIHFNSAAYDREGNGKTTGTEVLIYDLDNKETNTVAKRVADAISELGFRNRGVKERSGLYVLKNTKAKAMLIECCFVDDADDVDLYKYVGHTQLAKAIVKGITGKVVNEFVTVPDTPAPKLDSFLVKVKVNSLNIRSGAGAEYKITGTIKDKGTYTIVSTHKAKDGGTWGKLKSGVGYINISSKYVTKL